MRVYLVWLLLFLSAATISFGQVSILEVGIKGYYSTTLPTPVRIAVAAPPAVNSVRLDFTLSGGDPDSYQPLRTDHFSQQIDVKPGESNRLEIPILIASSNKLSLAVDAIGPGGQKIGSSTIKIDPASQTPVAIMCEDRKLYDEAQSQISFGGNDEETTEKNRDLKFVTLSAPRDHWWDYGTARFVVLATPIRAWTPDERTSLEYYLRSGGAVFLLEKEADDTTWLPDYRQSRSASEPVRVGEGRLYRVPSIESKQLSSLFTGKSYQKIVGAGAPAPYDAYWGNSPLDWLRRRVGVSFDFPSLRWVLLWLTVYLLVIGIGNFTLLRRLRRLEWGWLTMTLVAVLFACGLYLASSTRRPKHMILDDIVVYRLDSRSTVALEQIALRASSPDRLQTTLSVGGDAVLDGRHSAPAKAVNADIATEITNAQRIQPGWEMRLGDPTEIQLSLLRWSFTDLDFLSFHRFPGSVSVDQDLRLKNDTGQSFREGLYLDLKKNLKYFVPGVAAGQVVDLRGISPTAAWREESPGVNRIPFPTNVPEEGPFSLKTAFYGNLGLLAEKRYFVGLSDQPVPEANLAGVGVVRQNFALTIVSLDEP